jgi:hypothetical protein
VVLSDTPASSTTKARRHDIAEILMKVALNTKSQIKSKYSATHEPRRSYLLFISEVPGENHSPWASNW